MQEQDVVISTESDDLSPSGYRSITPETNSLPTQLKRISGGKNLDAPTMETKFPASVSIADLLKAGKLVKPPNKNKVKLTFEKFDVQDQEWQEVMEQDVVIKTKVFIRCLLRCFQSYKQNYQNSPTMGRKNIQPQSS